jgi:ATP-dependent phosphoenolpyruvate carboxykinase
LRFGAVLENVVLEEDRTVDFADTTITENTRGAYPIEFIRSARVPCVAGHPSDVIFLTCDAFGVLPPVSALSPAQAMYVPREILVPRRAWLDAAAYDAAAARLAELFRGNLKAYEPGVTDAIKAARPA